MISDEDLKIWKQYGEDRVLGLTASEHAFIVDMVREILVLREVAEAANDLFVVDSDSPPDIKLFVVRGLLNDLGYTLDKKNTVDGN